MATVNEEVRVWLSELDAARKREKKWRNQGSHIIDIYSGEKKDSTPFNILYSNTETLLPALFGSVPRPVVQRRFKSEDPLGKAASEASQRALEYTVDTNLEEHQTFSEAIEDAVLDGLLPGRGIVRVVYEATTPEVDGVPMLDKEYLCYASVDWNRFLHGYARKWVNVPWVSFEHDLDKGEVEVLCGKKVAEDTLYTAGAETQTGEEDKKNEGKEEGRTDRKTAKVYEVWVRRSKKVVFVSSHHPDGIMKEEEDPLELSGFFPVPRPLQFLKKSSSLVPTAIYSLYENQAKELNTITIRINKLISAMKIRGGYNTQVKEIEDILKKDDNTLVPITNAQALEGARGLESAIWLVPIEKIIQVIQQLFIDRENCKQVIYEITGIADILRGVSKASETLGAQEIKAKWGGLRIKRSQNEVQRFCVDLLRMGSEIMATKFSETTWKNMTQLPFSTGEELMQAQQVTQISQATGQPVPPEAQQVMAKPPWPAVLQLLKDDTTRSYRVDIETNSSLMAEASEDQQQIMELLTAVGQFLGGITPLVTSGSLPFGAAQSVLLAIIRRFRFGMAIEDQIMQMKPPTPPEADKSKEQAGKLKMDTQAATMELKGKEQEVHAKIREEEFKLREQEMELAFERKMFELEKAMHQQSVAGDIENLAMREKGVVQKGKEVASDVKQHVNALTNAKTQLGLVQKGMEETGKVQNSSAQMVQQLARTQAAMMEAIQQVTKLVGAERESELVVDEKTGKKTARSRLVGI